MLAFRRCDRAAPKWRSAAAAEARHGEGVMDQTGVNWNHLVGWLERVQALRATG